MSQFSMDQKELQRQREVDEANIRMKQLAVEIQEREEIRKKVYGDKFPLVFQRHGAPVEVLKKLEKSSDEAQAGTTTAAKIGTQTRNGKRRIGRPPGSKNKPK